MKLLLKALSLAGLVMTVVPAFLVLYGTLTWTAHARLMVVGMVFWFATAPFWMKGE
ncbi:MAG: hypothetical protein Kow001_09690 [Acidobacteriota bacterium]